MADRGTFTYLGLGAGVQSTALLAMSAFGLKGCPKADVAVFADTQAEPAHVYEHLEKLKALSPISIVTVTAGDLTAASIGGKRTMIPAFTDTDGKSGILRRKCTSEYKVAPILKWVRAHLGYQPRQRVRHQVVSLIGISVDEIERAKPSDVKWATRLHPLIDADMRRSQCIKLLSDIGWPVPSKSSCVFCPFHDDALWRDLRDNHPEDFAKAVQFDRDIRVSTKAGVKSPVFLHRSLVPLDQVEFKPAHTTPLFDSFTEECEGRCGI